MYNFLPNFNFSNIDPTATNLLLCPDQYVAYYSPGNTGNELSQRYYTNINYVYDMSGNNKCTNKKKNTIAIILESPHRDEYEYVNGVLLPKGPLCGKWTDFEKSFHKAIGASSVAPLLKNKATYNIAFINAIQYQCSQGRPLWNNIQNRAQKNSNVINCWHTGFDADLIHRLTSLNPSIIINLSGKEQKISCLIEQAVLNAPFLCAKGKSKQSKYTKGCHPSSWQRQINKNPNVILID